jgi:hypothetical protein
MFARGGFRFVATRAPGQTDAFPSCRFAAHGPRTTETLRASFGGGGHRGKSSSPKKKDTERKPLAYWDIH